MKFDCPHCKQSIKANNCFGGETINCSVCKKQIQVPYFIIDPLEKATEKQIAYIRALGGTLSDDLTKERAMEIIDKLRATAPPTKKQLDLLANLGATIPEKLTSAQASDLISGLLATREFDVQTNKDRIADFYRQKHEKRANRKGKPLVILLVVIIVILLFWWLGK